MLDMVDVNDIAAARPGYSLRLRHHCVVDDYGARALTQSV